MSKIWKAVLKLTAMQEIEVPVVLNFYLCMLNLSRFVFGLSVIHWGIDGHYLGSAVLSNGYFIWHVFVKEAL